MPKPPHCGMCGQEHWSSQPCVTKGVTKSLSAVTEQVTPDACVTERVTKLRAAEEKALPARVTALTALVADLQKRIVALEAGARPLAMTSAEKQRAYRERKKALNG